MDREIAIPDLAVVSTENAQSKLLLVHRGKVGETLEFAWPADVEEHRSKNHTAHAV